MNEELRRKKKSIESESQALILNKEDRKGRSMNRELQHEDERGVSKSRKNIRCFHYQKLGHYKNQCKLLKREKSVKRDKSKKDEYRDVDETTTIIFLCFMMVV